ncbi:MipA/OmpV family protein [Paraferrimonas sp. SM1919]|uniref:MipA/OmpV family protein n=1 Tax=Paraferrimonas sp. SM1919 TaxID=2662263 RepID=UPI0013D0FD0C|nr:MipA/OmpV family protein [Paraferrimonas sp. SM1919]
MFKAYLYLFPILVFVPWASAAQQKITIDETNQPLWEFGLGVGAAVLPDYLGSDQSSTYVLPAPYIRYRGEKFKADRQGVRGIFYDSEKLDLNLSFSGSLPVQNEQNEARRGMNNLDLVAEVGPKLEYQLQKTSSYLLRLDLSARGAFSIGNPMLYHRGWTFEPRFYYERELGQWLFTSKLSSSFSDQRYHQYYFGVAPEFSTETRPSYQAKAGYTGTELAFKVRRRYQSWYFNFGVKYFSLHGSAYQDSPLVRQNHYVSATALVSYIFGQSNTSK